jgi:hypothetical protein
MHDQRVTDAILAGASSQTLRQIMATVTAEYRERITAEAAAAQRRADILWIDRAGRPVTGNTVPLPPMVPVPMTATVLSEILISVLLS